MNESIIIKGARTHNLKNITVSIPKNKFVVLTGLSGSGKSTLAFEILHKEGQRQYLESMGMVTDYLTRPKIDSITGLSPSICIDQHLTNRSPRSTVGTETEIYTYLRVLFAKLGHRKCPECGKDVPPDYQDSESSSRQITLDDDDTVAKNIVRCPSCGFKLKPLGMADFSFNKPEGACPVCTGLGVIQDIRLERLFNENKSIIEGAVTGWDTFLIRRYAESLEEAGRHYGFAFDAGLPIKAFNQVQRDLFLYGAESSEFTRHFPGLKPPETVPKGRFGGIVISFKRKMAGHAENAGYREKMSCYLTESICPDCGGLRLRRESREVTAAGITLPELSSFSLAEISAWLERLALNLTEAERIITEPILYDLKERLSRILETGIGYLSMDRSSPTLSAGEAQRLRLANLIGSGLTGVIYVLDEPTLGLHQKDTEQLIGMIRKIRDLGNTAVVIEHDLEVIRSADYVIDMGPGAGRQGGFITACGTPEQVAEINESVTGLFLSGRLEIPVPEKRRKASSGDLIIRNIFEHNLKNITIGIPFEMLTVLTGVSGSGKSTIVFDILDKAARNYFNGADEKPGKHGEISGWEFLKGVITVDQQAIGRTPRSNAATYTDSYTYIRKAFSSLPESRSAGWSEGHFSFNVPGGRCEKCEGAGEVMIPMHFLPDVEVPCPVCHGKRFKPELLSVLWKGCSISDVLNMTIEEAYSLFEEIPQLKKRLSLMKECGLGYLQLGQPATTLSGGEAQRIKLAKELGRTARGKFLYLLDEPTTGLHPQDVRHLLKVLTGLSEAGNTVLVIEHNPDVIKSADWVIDLGPEGGNAGGEIIAEGTPEEVAKNNRSHTGRMLRKYLM